MELLKQRSLCPRRTDLPGLRLFAVSLRFWLISEIAARRVRVPEFQFIREEALRRGLRVWLFGGTAAGYSHYGTRTGLSSKSRGMTRRSSFKS